MLVKVQIVQVLDEFEDVTTCQVVRKGFWK